MNRIDSFWDDFIERTNRDKSVKAADAYYFGLSKESADDLLDLVLLGKKRATASSMHAYTLTGEEMPAIGDLCILTDFEGNPKCVVETIGVTVLPFSEMTFEICKREGEDDTLESWKDGHSRFFSTEGRQIGYEFTTDMPVVFEDFKVVFVQQNAVGVIEES